MIKIVYAASWFADRRFYSFSHQLYRGIRLWREPDVWGGRRVLSPAFNRMCRQPHVKLLAVENGKILGRMLVGLNPVLKRGYFSLFDAVDNEAVVQDLMREALLWQKSQGIREIVGPIAPTPVDLGGGVLCDGFDEKPAFNDGYNFPYYSRCLEKCGLVTDSEWLAYRMDMRRFDREKYRRIAEWVSVRFECAVRNDLVKRPRIYAEAVWQIMGDEIDRESANRLIDRMLPYAVPELCLVVYVRGKAAAFLLTIRKGRERVRIVSMWVHEKHRRQGMTAMLFHAFAEGMDCLKERFADASMVNADNSASKISIESVGGSVVHRYKIYQSKV